jgi:hypothetical protein
VQSVLFCVSRQKSNLSSSFLQRKNYFDAETYTAADKNLRRKDVGEIHENKIVIKSNPAHVNVHMLFTVRLLITFTALYTL